MYVKWSAHGQGTTTSKTSLLLCFMAGADPSSVANLYFEIMGQNATYESTEKTEQRTIFSKPIFFCY